MQAVREAFPTGLFPTLRDISLCTEPEACALYTMLKALEVDRCRLQNASLPREHKSVWSNNLIRVSTCRETASSFAMLGVEQL